MQYITQASESIKKSPFSLSVMEDETLENLVKDQVSVRCYLKAIVENTAMIHLEIDGENKLICYSKRDLEAAGVKERMYFKIVPYKDEDTDKIRLNFIPCKEETASSDEQDYASTTTRISVGSWWNRQKS